MPTLGEGGHAARHGNRHKGHVFESGDLVLGAPYGQVGSVDLDDLGRAERRHFDAGVSLAAQVIDAHLAPGTPAGLQVVAVDQLPLPLEV